MRKLTALIATLILCVLVFVPPVYAEDANVSEENVIELTLDQALYRALFFNNALEKTRLEVEQKDDARVSVRSATYYTEWSLQAEASIFSAESTRFAYEQARKSYDIQRDSVKMDVIKKYYDVLSALEKLEAKKLSYTHTEAEARAARAMFNVGMLSRLALEGAEAKLDGAKVELAAAQADLDNAYLALNQLVRYGANERPVLTDTVSFEPVDQELSVYESRALSDNLSLEMARAAADYMNRVENYSVGREIMVTSTDVKKAELDEKTACDGVQKLIRHLYSGVKTLEESYAAAQRGLAIAEENLRITQLKYEVGLVAKKEVLKAEADFAAAQQRVTDLAAQHTYMKEALETPWAYVSSGP